MLPTPPTYPAKPMNGGRLEHAEPLEGNWQYKPKYNGRRVLMHVPTCRTWNRQLEEVAYNNIVFTKLKAVVEASSLWPGIEWLDLEFLWGRHSIGKGSVIVLDFIVPDITWVARQSILKDVFQDYPVDKAGEFKKDSIYFSQGIAKENAEFAWLVMQDYNREHSVVFYEGLVAYEVTKPYPIQLFGPNRETRHWMKYRFIN